jgi:signal transduction histidine kinase
MSAAASTMTDLSLPAPAPAPRDHDDERPRLLLRFALYAGAVLLAAGCAITWLVDREVAGRAERTVARQATAIVAGSLRERLRPSDFDRPVTQARRAQLDRLFRRSILPGVVGGRLVAANGRLTYASDHALIGGRVRDRSALDGVLAGNVERSVAEVQTAQAKGLKVLRVVVPVRLSGRRRALGAVELDQDYRAVGVGVGDARWRLALILGLALLALYLSLFPILHRVTRQLADQNRRLREDAHRLRELDALKDEFVSLVSHELRTPLTSIRGYVELLEDEGGLSDEQRRFLGVVDRNSARLLELVGDLLFLAQADAGRLEFQQLPVDLGGIVDEAVESSLPAAREKRIDLRSDVEATPQLQGDPARLAQVLDNLVSNALKFTPAGGRVVVRLRTASGSALLEVSDTGHGLPAEERDRLFERFFRSSRASEDAIPGTGLGLAIAKTIVERHGGRISLESAVGEGTTVRVELPLSQRELKPSRQELAA